MTGGSAVHLAVVVVNIEEKKLGLCSAVVHAYLVLIRVCASVTFNQVDWGRSAVQYAHAVGSKRLKHVADMCRLACRRVRAQPRTLT